MNQGSDSTPDAGQTSGSDPYQQLGVAGDASFEEVQSARQQRLSELGDDPMARARVEAAYDAILMNRLRERQQGRVSTAARSASQREQLKPPTPAGSAGPSLPRLPQLPMGGLPRPALSLPSLPSLQLASGRELWFPLACTGVLLLLLFALSSPPAELILSLATLATLLNLQRRNGRFLVSLGWSFTLLCLGLLAGGMLAASLDPSLPLGLPIALVQVQSLPVLLLLLLGALFIA
jgi:hypothetical protein